MLKTSEISHWKLDSVDSQLFFRSTSAVILMILVEIQGFVISVLNQNKKRDLNNMNRGWIVISFFEIIFKIVPDFQDCPEKIQAGREFKIETDKCVY